MYVGQPLLRDEDYRFLRGDGQFTADVEVPNALWAAFVRSPHAHAVIERLSTAPASAMPGVHAVLTAEDWRAAGLGAPHCQFPMDSSDGTPMRGASRAVFVDKVVRHVGDTIAAVIAETREQALDAAEAIEVDYEPLASVTDPMHALDADAPIIHEALGSNLVQSVEHGDAQATDRAFARAAHVTALTLRNTRVAALPLEPRSAIGLYERAGQRFTLWASVQNPHIQRSWLAEHVLGVPIHRVRVISPDVGGGFGVKSYFYAEPAVVLYAARRLGRPVRWTATRSEAFVVDAQARDLVTRAEMAFDEAGNVLAIRGEAFAAYGAYISNAAPLIVTAIFPTMLSGLYRTGAVHLTVNGVYTNAVPVDAYRGGTQVTTHINERLLETGATELGLDGFELRRQNYLTSSDYPYVNPLGSTYDSGDPPAQHNQLMALGGLEALREEQPRLRRQGIRLGIGMAGFVETTGMGPSRSLAGTGFGGWESAVVRVNPDGKVVLFPGTHSHGQSHEITFRQVAADALGLPIEDIDFTQGDTELGPGNFGTAAARAISLVGAAILKASERIIAKATILAAHRLECAQADVEYADGVFTVPGTDLAVPFKEIVALAYNGADYPEEGFELGLEETVFEDPTHYSNPTGIHLAVVLVDEETGVVTLRDYFTVDECGRVINPMVVHGQVHGGLAQGIGQALLERIVHDPDSGQLITGSFIDYAMPRADDLPSFRGELMDGYNPNNSLGVKGGSESGVCGPTAAIGNAIVDALRDLRVRHIDIPYLPETVRSDRMNNRFDANTGTDQIRLNRFTPAREDLPCYVERGIGVSRDRGRCCAPQGLSSASAKAGSPAP